MLAWIFLISCSTEKKDLLETEIEDNSSVDLDSDQDGYLASEDCNDNDAMINPGAIEVCDDLDNNCDGNIDENVLSSYYLDGDGDGFGDSQNYVESCQAPSGYVLNGNDCDDADPGRYPSAIEVCDDIDNNCNEEVDEDLGDLWYYDGDGDGFGDDEQSQQACEQPEGYLLQGGDCQDDNADIFPGQDEICDDVDNNCDGNIDEVGNILWFADVDEDGYGDPNSTIASCTQPSGHLDNSLDCDDSNPAINPDAIESCDGIDNNCNGILGDGATDAPIWYEDADLDGYGNDSVTTYSCSQPPGYSANADDCDDARFETSPSRQEYCNGIDDDCDGDTDEESIDATVFFSDLDGDGYGDVTSPVNSCSLTAGLAANSTDCNDDPTQDGATIYPYATEYCNGVDDNCNTVIDEMASDRQNFYQDADGDGFGGSLLELACEASVGFVAPQYDSSGALLYDCNDDPTQDGISIYPGATETCNETDDDCNGLIDEGIPTDLWYADLDGDGYGDPNNIEYNCLQPTNFIAQEQDCDDSRDDINPDGIESCNGLDDDCDGSADAGQLGLDEICPAANCKDIQSVDSTLADGMYFINVPANPAATCSDATYTNQADCEAAAVCSDSTYSTESDCVTALETWGPRWGVVEEMQCDMGSFSGGWTLVFSDDMSPPDSGWTLQETYICGAWGEILGGYDIISGGEFSNTISTLGIDHTELWVEMDYITLDSWDDTGDIYWGPDEAYVGFNGNTDADYIWFTDIDNHLSIYGQVCGWGSPQEGYNDENFVDQYGSYYTHDSRHYVSTIESGYFNEFSLYVGSTLSQNARDESFGLDDVYVWVR
ncbi:MAG: putative metal-binding motif-containing protein [Myxococcota bacterium]|nr:putative metal-binding motif-containing protein [Myxococcota bacterium]